MPDLVRIYVRFNRNMGGAGKRVSSVYIIIQGVSSLRDRPLIDNIDYVNDRPGAMAHVHFTDHMHMTRLRNSYLAASAIGAPKRRLLE